MEWLFSDDSYESWQVRTCNVLTILSELVESTQIASKVNSHHPNIKNLLDELKYTVKEDIIVKRYYPNASLYLDKMLKVYNVESSKNNPNDNYKRLLGLLDRLKNQDRNYIQASLQYYRLSLLANNHESKLVNLWIALESLFQENEGNIIGNISRHIPVIMARNYVKDILRSVSVDLRFLWRREPFKAVLDLAKRSNPYVVHPHDLLIMLLKEDDSLEYKHFMKYISENPLLLFRVDNLKKGLFHSPKYLRDRLERHKQNIEWQLRRIYRIRNKIMHQGLVNIDTSKFILHQYYP